MPSSPLNRFNFNHCHVDLADFGLLKLNFGKIVHVAAVPEPATIALLFVGSLLTVAEILPSRRRRRA